MKKGGDIIRTRISPVDFGKTKLLLEARPNKGITENIFTDKEYSKIKY